MKWYDTIVSTYYISLVASSGAPVVSAIVAMMLELDSSLKNNPAIITRFSVEE